MLRRLHVFAFLAAFASLSLYGQNFGEITGTVSDSTGAVIAGATITVTNTATNQARAATSNASGNYSVPYLVPGVYDLRTETPGFKVVERKGVEIQVGAVARLDFRLEVGELTQKVEVTGGAPLLATDTVALGSVIATRQIVDLPLNGRDYLALVSLSPNVSTEAVSNAGSSYQGGVRSAVSLSVAGQRLEFNHYTLDGVENTDPNFNSYIIRPSVDFIQEFKAQTGVYSAEFGKGASQINVTTKAGTNDFHGAAFEFLRNSYFDAAEWNAVGAKNPFRRNDYGFTLGGPVVIPKILNGRNRLFFTSNFEESRDRLTTQATASVATTAMRNGDFSAVSQTIYDPNSRVYNSAGVPVSATPFPNNTIPRDRFNGVALKLFSYYPDPIVGGNTLLRNYYRNTLSTTDSDQFNQRIDFVESNKSSWFGRYSWADDTAAPGGVFDANLTVSVAKVKQGVLSNTRIISPSVVNEARFAWAQFNNDLVSTFAYQRNVQSELGVDGLSALGAITYGVPGIGLAQGVTGFGGPTPWITRDNTFQWLDNVSLLKGKHSIKIGGEVRRDRYNQLGTLKSTGEFDFDGASTALPGSYSTTGFAFADYMLGLPSQALRAVALGNAMLRRNVYTGYVQDDWKITPKLTVNLGVRYENSRPWHDKYRGMINVQVSTLGVTADGKQLVPGAASPIITRPGNGNFYDGINLRYASNMPVQAGDQYMGTGLVNPNNHDFGPRIGLAYNPANHWSIRTGFGIFYVQDIGNAVFDMARNLGGRDGNVVPQDQRTTTLNSPWASEKASPLCPGWSGACLITPQIQTNYQGNRTPYVEQYMFNVQRELTQDVVVEAGYLGNQGHHLSRFVIFNQAVLKSGATDSRSVAARRPFPGFGPIQEVLNVVNSDYNALDFKLTQRFHRGLTYLLGYTWAKAIDDGSGIRTNSGDTLWPTNSYNLSMERGLSQFNVSQRLVASFVYELPFGAGKPVANSGIVSKIVGGWQLGGIVTFAAGTPINGTQLGDTANLGNLGNQMDATGISPIPANRTAQQYWNKAAFDYSNPELNWRPGNLGRNTLLTPGRSNLDASLARNIRLHENHALNFRFEAFNATNHPNWNAPSTDPRSSTFGIITSARTMRQLQLALKYTF
jgi:hypothetical protein